jgi:hypothetical protein
MGWKGRNMSILSKLSQLLSPGKREEQSAYWIYTRCKRCGETIRARVNLSNDLSAEYDGENSYFNCRKVLIGEGRCFQQIEVHLRFDSARKLLDQEISGGEFISAEEYSTLKQGS